MPRFYFHVRDNGELYQDTEGADIETLEAAREEALRAAREIMAERVREGLVLDGQVFEITSEAGEVLASVPFKAAIKQE